MASGKDSDKKAPAQTAKKDVKDSKEEAAKKGEEAKGKQTAALDELDDAFEDFPADEWDDSADSPDASKTGHLWEDTWEDEDQVEDFAAQLKAEHEKLSGPQPMKT